MDSKRLIQSLSFTFLLMLIVNCSEKSHYSSDEIMVIELPEDSKKELDTYIDHAKLQKVIPEQDKEYVKAYLLKSDRRIKIKMRLKGDWTDHLTFGHPSYRVKIKGACHFHHLKEFSIQHPKTRNYLHEWILHRIAEEEGLLTTQYGFETVQVGADLHETYAYEEHFAKQLVERRKRREGPILKFDEATTWDFLSQGYEQSTMDEFPYFEASRVSVFKKNKTTRDISLLKSFTEGKKLLAHFKNGTAELADIFDIEQLAKFYVLMELSGSNHGLRWHNRRFYYNPITQKLEHIAYDLVPFSNPDVFHDNFLEQRMKSGALMVPFNFDAQIFLNPTFKKNYLQHLERMTSKNYYQKMLAKIWPDLVNYHHALAAHHEGYSFDGSIYQERLKSLRANSSELERFWNLVLEKRSSPGYWQRSITYKKRNDSLFAPAIGLNAYRTALDTGYSLQVQNFHVNSIEWVGYLVKEVEEPVFFKQAKILEGYKTAPDETTMELPIRPDELLYRVSNKPDRLFRSNVTQWSIPKGNTARMELMHRFDSTSAFFQIKGNQLVLNKQLVLTEPLLIPERFEVIIRPGTSIKLKEQGGLIICGSLNASGTKDQPIKIIGMDTTNNGLVVLNGAYAKLAYVQLENVSNLDYKNWTLTGALSIHETPTYMTHVTVSNNHSEDAINLIRCPFIASYIYLSSTFSDGIDMDFCRGELRYVKIDHAGNDGVDFSGSQVSLVHVEINHAIDKGVSGGEKSTLIIEDLVVKDAITGIASKDASIIIGETVEVQAAEFGTSAFCKKDEYGPATIELTSFIQNGVKKPYLLDKGSVVILNDEKWIGNQPLNIDSLYAPFEK